MLETAFLNAFLDELQCFGDVVEDPQVVHDQAVALLFAVGPIGPADGLETGRPERFRSPAKSDRLGTGIGDRVRPGISDRFESEWVIGLPGFGDRLGPEAAELTFRSPRSDESEIIASAGRRSPP